MEYSNNYLAHHGILGQKWGKRNGPPYPLDAEARTAEAKEKQHARIVKTGEKYRDKPHHESQYSDKKNAVSLKAAGHKTMAKIYEMNEKAYSKSNSTLASMNRAAKEEALKKAHKAQNEANKKAENRNGPAAAIRTKQRFNTVTEEDIDWYNDAAKHYSKLNSSDKKRFGEIAQKIADETRNTVNERKGEIALKIGATIRNKQIENTKKSINDSKNAIKELDDIEKYQNSKESKGLSDKQKNALKVGAAVVGAALVGYSIYKVNQNTKAELDALKALSDTMNARTNFFRNISETKVDVIDIEKIDIDRIVPKVTNGFQESIKKAEEMKVDPSEILRTIDDIDKFFK